MSRRDYGDPSKAAEELLGTGGRDHGRIGAGQAEQEVDGALLVQRDQKVVGILPDATVVARDRPHVVLHRAITAAETLLIADALVHGLDGEASRGWQGGILPEHPLDRRGMRAELGIPAAPRPVRLWVRMREHLADGLLIDAGFPTDLSP